MKLKIVKSETKFRIKISQNNGQILEDGNIERWRTKEETIELLRRIADTLETNTEI